MNLVKPTVVAALASVLFAGASFAQTNANPSVNANNLVSVNISNVAQNIANDLDVDVQDVINIGSVEVPIGVAATVCNVQANVLSADNKADGAECEAQSTSQALTQIVQRSINGG
jgi:hypothetical protein